MEMGEKEQKYSVSTRATCTKVLEPTAEVTINTNHADCVQCKLDVPTGSPALQCDSCDGWIHCTCADVSDDLYSCLQTTPSKVIRVVCLHCLPQRGETMVIKDDESAANEESIAIPLDKPSTSTAPSIPTRKERSKRQLNPANGPRSPTKALCIGAPKLAGEPVAQTVTVKLLSLMDCKYQSLLNSLADECTTTGKAVHGLQTSLSEIRQELMSLNEYVATSLPGPIAAKEAVRLSAGQIKGAAAEMADKALREQRIILWGHFQQSLQPTEKARQLLSPFVTQLQGEELTATWLRGKSDQQIHGLLVDLPSTLSPGALLDMKSAILPLDADLRGISLDRPVGTRKTRQAYKGKPSRLDDHLLRKKAVVLLEQLKFPSCEPSLDESYASIGSTLPVTSTPRKSPSPSGFLEQPRQVGSATQLSPPSNELEQERHNLHTYPIVRKIVITTKENNGLLGAPSTQNAIDFFHQRQKRRKPPDHKRQALKNPLQNQCLWRPAQQRSFRTPMVTSAPQETVQTTCQVNPLLPVLLSLLGMRCH